MKNTTPFVSVVVPVYNVEQYLEDCFNSIVSQTYENIEIILVNDGSTDNSGRLADKLASTDMRARVIHKKNGGLSDARNTGTADSKGEWVTFIDSDDTVHGNFVEILIKAALKTDSDIAQCDNSRKIEDLGKGSEKTKTLSGKDAFIELMKYKVVSPTAWGKIYKRSLFVDNSILFPVGRIHEDTAVMYKLIYKARRIAFSDKILYYYRLNESSIMNSNYTNRHYESVVRYDQELNDFITTESVDVSHRSIDRHMALRYVSVLSRIAVSGEGYSSESYANIKKRFSTKASGSNSIVCYACFLPVYLPISFKILSSSMPIIRKVLGKT